MLPVVLMGLALLGCSADPDQDGDGSPASVDCDDADPNRHPEALELCDGADNDCDGLVDDADDSISEAALDSWYLDADGDGWGGRDVVAQACEAPEGAVAEAGDCDDDDPAVYPAAQEVCDGIDNDCDGLADDADSSLDPADRTLWYVDADGDGFGDLDDSGTLFCAPPAGWSAEQTDCDDRDAEIHPEMDEVCGDDLDNDCSGDAPECAFLGGFDPEDAGLSLVVSTPQEFLGKSVAVADFNGDGQPALALGMPGSDALATNGGAVLVIDRGLAPGGSPVVLSSIASIGSEDFLGNDVGVAGDVNGDGRLDLLIGNAARSGTSYAAVYPSNADGGFDSGVRFFRGLGDSDNPDDFGSEVARVGDLSGDGVDDVLVGAAAHGGTDETGIVYLWDSVASNNSPSNASGSLTGQSGDALGARDTVLGADLNGDGAQDLLSTAPATGRAYLLLGPVSGASLAADSDSILEGAGDFGQSPVSADLNDDGYPDLVIGAPEDVDAFDDAVGVSFVFFGQSAPWAGSLVAIDAALQIQGEQIEERVGSAQLVADLDEDGQVDLLLGQAGLDADRGGAALFLGPLEAGLMTTGDAQATFTGEPGGRCGDRGTLAVGDLDSDGRIDVVLACPQEGDSLQGAVHLFFGQVP